MISSQNDLIARQTLTKLWMRLLTTHLYDALEWKATWMRHYQQKERTSCFLFNVVHPSQTCLWDTLMKDCRLQRSFMYLFASFFSSLYLVCLTILTKTHSSPHSSPHRRLLSVFDLSCISVSFYLISLSIHSFQSGHLFFNQLNLTVVSSSRPPFQNPVMTDLK